MMKDQKKKSLRFARVNDTTIDVYFDTEKFAVKREDIQSIVAGENGIMVILDYVDFGIIILRENPTATKSGSAFEQVLQKVVAKIKSK